MWLSPKEQPGRLWLPATGTGPDTGGMGQLPVVGGCAPLLPYRQSSPYGDGPHRIRLLAHGARSGQIRYPPDHRARWAGVRAVGEHPFIPRRLSAARAGPGAKIHRASLSQPALLTFLRNLGMKTGAGTEARMLLDPDTAARRGAWVYRGSVRDNYLP